MALGARDTTAHHLVCAPALNSMAVTDLMREIEQPLRTARLRIAIEGEDVAVDVFETLAYVAIVIDEKLR